jgi:ribosomal protection tetracycline resistance protein
VETVVPAGRIRDLQQALPALTAGEGVLESTFYAYRPLHGDPRTRSRTTADPRQRASYLASLTRHGRRG